MPSRDEVERFAQANRDIRTLALTALADYWAQLDTQDADATRDALLVFVPLLVAEYGEVAATVAADFYDEARDRSGVPGRFAASLGTPVDAEQVTRDVRWAVGPLYSRTSPDPVSALGLLSQKVDERALQPGRDTIARSTRRDPAGPRWARVPVGKTCAFCLMLASRGATYRSEETAAGRYHGHCDCTPAPFWPKDPYPDGYDPDALYEQYNAARQAAGSGRPKAILAELRKDTGGH